MRRLTARSELILDNARDFVYIARSVLWESIMFLGRRCRHSGLLDEYSKKTVCFAAVKTDLTLQQALDTHI
jgi:hypothetical protein